MTGRVIDRETAGFLVLLIPLAILAVLLLKAWPYILGLIGLIMAWKLWQNYQWLKWSEKINPFFNQLVKENQGCLTSMDLSLKTNLTGGAAQRFLNKKAEEYGAQRKHIEDQGTVYYFLTASALGSILDQSEPILEEEIKPSTSNPLISPSPVTKSYPQESSVNDVSQLVELQEKPSESFVEEKNAPIEELQTSKSSTSQEIEQEDETALPEKPDPQQKDSTVNLETDSNKLKLELIQADLAKRLEINPSTVGRRKTDPDFAEWSQSKDPEGIAWKYKPRTKTFVPIEEEKL